MRATLTFKQVDGGWEAWLVPKPKKERVMAVRLTDEQKRRIISGFFPDGVPPIDWVIADELLDAQAVAILGWLKKRLEFHRYASGQSYEHLPEEDWLALCAEFGVEP